MSRPKVNEKDKRTIQVNIRLTTSEASAIDEHAKASGTSLGPNIELFSCGFG